MQLTQPVRFNLCLFSVFIKVTFNNQQTKIRANAEREPKQERAMVMDAGAHQRIRQWVLWRGAHQHGDAPGRTGGWAAATSKLATGQLTRVYKQDRKEERQSCYLGRIWWRTITAVGTWGWRHHTKVWEWLQQIHNKVTGYMMSIWFVLTSK